MKKPLILCTPSTGEQECRIKKSYLNALRNAGALPLMLPITDDPEEIERIVDAADGILFTGGVDIDPVLYGEEKLPECGEIDAERDRTEIALFKCAFVKKKPIFGICRGIQAINVAAGGTLWQDLPSQLPSDQRHAQAEPSCTETQTVHVEPSSLLATVLGKSGEVRVNSHHHQAVKAPAPLFVVSAKAEDDVIEAIECPSLPFCLAVQWHPERLCETDPVQKALFTAFAAACRKD